MQIFISPVSGSSICITVGNNCLYKDLKEIISEKFSIPTKYFKLVYNGKFIEHSFTDSNTLEEIGILENTTLRIKESYFLSNSI